MASYILDLHNGESLEFQQAPNRLETEASADLKRVAIVGLDQPRVIGRVGGKRDLNFDLDFYARDTGTEDTDFVVDAVAFLESFTITRVIREEPRALGLPPALLVLGAFLELPIHISKVRTVWGPFDGVEEMAPILARVNIRAMVAPVPRFLDAIAHREGSMVRKSYVVEEG